MLARSSLGYLLLTLAASLGAAQDRPVHTLESLSRLPWCELERIYREAEPGCRPEGYYRGHVVYRPCEFLAGPREGVANFVWQGKHFGDTTLINQWRGVRFIKAPLNVGESWLDGRPAHIFDYHGSSIIWSKARDEAREVSPGVYVGAMYLRRRCDAHLKVLFLLEKAECR